MAHEWEIGLGATASVTDDPDLRFVVETDRPGAYRIDVEELLKREILRLSEERDKLEAENSKLRYAESRLTSLRLEVDKRGERIAHLETLIRGHETNTRLFKARIDALIAAEDENSKLRQDNLSLVNSLEKEGMKVEDYQRETANLRIDLAAAIKTGEEQGEKINRLEAALKIDADRWADMAAILEGGGTYVNAGFFRASEARCRNVLAGRRYHDAVETGHCYTRTEPDGITHARLSRLEALLSSEEVPEGLRATLGVLTPVYAESAWRWFREQLGVFTLSTEEAEKLDSPDLHMPPGDPA